MPWIDETKCIKCNICADKCPVKGAISIKASGYPYINDNICTKCGICMEVCPKNAIRPNSENPEYAGKRNFKIRQNEFGLHSNSEFNKSSDMVIGMGTGRGMRRGGFKRGMGRGNRNY